MVFETFIHEEMPCDNAPVLTLFTPPVWSLQLVPPSTDFSELEDGEGLGSPPHPGACLTPDAWVPLGVEAPEFSHYPPTPWIEGGGRALLLAPLPPA